MAKDTSRLIVDDTTSVAVQLSAFRQRCENGAKPEVLERLNSLEERLDRLSGVEDKSPAVQTDNLIMVTCHPVNPNTISDLEFGATEQLETEVFYLNTESFKKQGRRKLVESDIQGCIQLCTRDIEETIVRVADGKVRIVAPLDTNRKYLSHRLHLKDDDGWKTISGVLKQGTFEATIPIPVKALVCVTSMGTVYDVTVGPNGMEHRFASNRDVLIRFPKGSVQSRQVVHVSLESADRSAIQQLKQNQPELSIVGYTDIVHIKHSEPFMKDICVELPMEMITSDDIAACELISVHFHDDDIVIDQKGNKLKKVGKNKIKLETSVFSGKSVVAKKRRHKQKKKKTDSENVHAIYGYNTPCSILVFLGVGPTENSWLIWGEIAPERDVEDVVLKRTNSNNLREPPNCRSGGKSFKKKTRIRVHLGSDGCFKMCNGVAETHTIVYLPTAKHNYISFPVTKTGTGEMAILHFKSETKKTPCQLYTAYFRPVGILPLSSESSDADQPTSFFDSRSMLTLVQNLDIGDLFALATELGISLVKYQDLRFMHGHHPVEFKMSIINKWLKSSTGEPEKALSQLTTALTNCDNNSVAEICKSVFREGRGFRKNDFK
ncbi:uncharacterized protein LOC110464627 [Mizuhopecten yessoensis]|uniref:uncharacterized protein LOC110464627 n=1 Tax=Mizuhopecten yessoensis TaxID=6573 RepID=UPI000B4597C8|nr:uncharacterized protein LOC110464627 [Mizuhopecten yessoensis]